MAPQAQAPSPSTADQCRGQATMPGGSRMELWISHVLRAGVLLAGAVITLGLVLLLVRGAGANDPVSLTALRLQDGRPLPVHPGDLIRHALGGQPIAVIQLGVLLLILTPVCRVAMTVWLFVEQRDPVFVAITLVVLAVLVFGLVHTGL
jgi:uncharacterized membrane protein